LSLKAFITPIRLDKSNEAGGRLCWERDDQGVTPGVLGAVAGKAVCTGLLREERQQQKATAGFGWGSGDVDRHVMSFMLAMLRGRM
jgi:hypothetical protein